MSNTGYRDVIIVCDLKRTQTSKNQWVTFTTTEFSTSSIIRVMHVQTVARSQVISILVKWLN